MLKFQRQMHMKHSDKLVNYITNWRDLIITCVCMYHKQIWSYGGDALIFGLRSYLEFVSGSTECGC